MNIVAEKSHGKKIENQYFNKKKVIKIENFDIKKPVNIVAWTNFVKQIIDKILNFKKIRN